MGSFVPDRFYRKKYCAKESGGCEGGFRLESTCFVQGSASGSTASAPRAKYSSTKSVSTAEPKSARVTQRERRVYYRLRRESPVNRTDPTTFFGLAMLCLQVSEAERCPLTIANNCITLLQQLYDSELAVHIEISLQYGVPIYRQIVNQVKYLI